MLRCSFRSIENETSIITSKFFRLEALKALRFGNISPLLFSSRTTACSIRRFSSSSKTEGESIGVEVEAKFLFTKEDEERIARDPEVQLIKKKSFTDVYYDAPSQGYPLTTRDIWLRQRSGNWEIKIPVSFYKHGQTIFARKQQKSATDEDLTRLNGEASPTRRATNTDSYVELEAPSEIHQFLFRRNLLKSNPKHQNELERILLVAGFEPCAKLTTQRTTYRHGDVNIDLDRSDPLEYKIGELEVMTGDGERNKAFLKIQAVAQHHHLDIRNGMRGKVLEYLRVFSPKHYKALDESGLLESKGILQ
jgi:adenylate cyclase class IV